ncbi:MAG: ATP-binding protein [Candidatus Polarisedimenticolia bacterium]
MRAQSISSERIDLHALRRTLRALRRGDFSVRMTAGTGRVAREISEDLNAIIDLARARTAELTRVRGAVGRKGKLGERACVPGSRGSWDAELRAVNDLIDDLVQPTQEMVRVIGAVTRGDLSQTMPVRVDGKPVQGAPLQVARTVNTMVARLGSVAAEVTRVAREVGTERKPGSRARVKGAAGVWKDLTNSVNLLAGNAEVPTPVPSGDVSRRGTVELGGEILRLKDTIETMADQLNEFDLFLTAADRGPEHALKAYPLKVVDHLLKPVKPEILRANVRVFVELHRKTRRLLETEQREHRMRMAEVQEQRDQFFSQALDMMAIAELDGRFREANPAWTACLGYTPQELQGRSLLSLVDPVHRETVSAVWERLRRSGERAIFECRCRAKGGSYRWLSWHAQAFADNRCVHAVARDVSPMKEAMEQLSLINADLEQFAYIAAHDLREPLRMVATCVMLLERRYKGRLGAEADELIGHAVNGATRMHTLIGDLLSYSRLRSEEHTGEPVDCARIVEMALYNLRQLVEESAASVHVGGLPSISGHPAHVQVVFQNLIENALKYRGEKPLRVEIAAEAAARGWIFSVKDNGIGIKPQYHERVFRMFQRLHDRHTQPGHGMGLAIVKKIVEQHGGRIWLESSPGRGTTIRFHMPEAAEEAVVSRSAGG